MITINDVAKLAGVSISTVSNVLNKSKFVSTELVQRVNDAVRDLEYSANPIAQKMKFKRTKTIGVITADLCGLFYPYVLKGMYEVFHSKGYRFILMDTEGISDHTGSIKKLRDGIFSLVQDRVDGIVFSSTIPADLEAGIINESMRYSSRKNTAFVCVEKDLSKFGIDSVCANSLLGADIATSHLIDVGCRRIGTITGPNYFTVAQDRIEGFSNAIARAGIALDKARMFANGDYTHKSGYLAMKELLVKMPDIDGVFSANDQMAVGALKALSEAGKRVPDDVKIIGYDDVFIASVLEPSLSTIHVKKHDMGRKAAELLINQIEHDEDYDKHTPTTIELESKLVVRQSTVRGSPDDWILVDW